MKNKFYIFPRVKTKRRRNKILNRVELADMKDFVLADYGEIEIEKVFHFQVVGKF